MFRSRLSYIQETTSTGRTVSGYVPRIGLIGRQFSSLLALGSIVYTPDVASWPMRYLYRIRLANDVVEISIRFCPLPKSTIALNCHKTDLTMALIGQILTDRFKDYSLAGLSLSLLLKCANPT